jgi:hypothetical protein
MTGMTIGTTATGEGGGGGGISSRWKWGEGSTCTLYPLTRPLITSSKLSLCCDSPDQRVTKVSVSSERFFSGTSLKRFRIGVRLNIL